MVSAGECCALLSLPQHYPGVSGRVACVLQRQGQQGECRGTCGVCPGVDRRGGWER